jgi:hypothetical protein
VENFWGGASGRHVGLLFGPHPACGHPPQIHRIWGGSG